MNRMPPCARTIILITLTAVLSVSACPVWAQAPDTNLEVMQLVTDAALRDLIARVSGELRGRAVILAPYGSDEQYEFMNHEMSRVLTSAGYRTITPNRAPLDSMAALGTGLELQYQALDFSLTYPKIYRPFLIGGKKVKRNARINLSVKIVDPYDQSVLWVGETSSNYEDSFSHKDIDEVEAGVYAFTKPTQDSKSIGKIVEPVVVSGIIVGLIYLFFSNQDSK